MCIDEEEETPIPKTRREWITFLFSNKGMTKDDMRVRAVARKLFGYIERHPDMIDMPPVPLGPHLSSLWHLLVEQHPTLATTHITMIEWGWCVRSVRAAAGLPDTVATGVFYVQTPTGPRRVINSTKMAQVIRLIDDGVDLQARVDRWWAKKEVHGGVKSSD